MSELEPDPELHPQEYLEWRIDKMYEESDIAYFAIMEQIIERIKQTVAIDEEV